MVSAQDAGEALVFAVTAHGALWGQGPVRSPWSAGSREHMHNLVRPGQRTAKTGSESEEGCSFAPRGRPGEHRGCRGRKAPRWLIHGRRLGISAPSRRRSSPFEPPRSVAALLSGSCQVTMRHFLTHRSMFKPRLSLIITFSCVLSPIFVSK